MTRFRFLLALAAILLVASPTLGDDAFAGAIETAHAADTWQSKAAFETQIKVTFGGNTMVHGTMLMTPDMAKVRFDLVDGTVLVFDGEEAYVSPADSAFQGARFHVLTWPYFVAAPYKLRDPGTQLEDQGRMPFAAGRALPAAKLTFGEGVGDSPDDWYIVYRNPGNDSLAGLAYIVTYGPTTTEQAEAEPHMVIYQNLEPVDGVPVPTVWSFHDWSADSGSVGDVIGEVELNAMRFVEPAPDAFVPPKDARVDALPGRN
ncbi:MAG: hypothetical protein AAGD38_15050 [Acidobacteriota bacterium]